jgi:hypothetical protein
VLFTPASIVMDIIRLAVAPHKVNGFIVFLDVIEMLLKANPLDTAHLLAPS